MEEDRELVTFADDDGNEFSLEILDGFCYEGQDYAILVDPEELDAAQESEEAMELEYYIMKVVLSEDGEYEEYLPADDDKMDELAKLAEECLSCDCDECDDEECDCGCCHEHEEE